MSDYRERLGELRKKLAEEELQQAVILSRENICYLTGFCVGSNERLTALIVNGKETSLVVPKLSQGQVRDIGVDKTVTWDDRDDPYAIAKEIIGSGGKGRIALESQTPLSLYMRFKDMFGPDPVFADQLMVALRQRKRGEEVEFIRKAVEISEKALEETTQEIKPGMTEKEVAGILEYNMRRNGSDGNAFSTTVASGKNSANPHHVTSDSRIEAGSSLVIDFGASYRNYSSDTTRTFVVGSIPEGFKDVYETVRKAQQTGIDCANPGIPAGDIDIEVRKVIENAGYGEYFTHRTGHGIGLETHEPPYINESNRSPLQPPATFTIEPGIYIQGKYGVRIEDTVLMDEKGTRAVNSFSKELRIL
ncbi:hypothetical protein IX51_04875 [uncultured archaeon]|nr:hypothetical protein IX51_04875 [uncultured archaeon]